jgi:uncharacterized paraquat-inducible protein A
MTVNNNMTVNEASAVRVVCPTCNTLSTLDALARDASSFCPTCDYPLFWAKPAGLPPRGAAVEAKAWGSRRRLPGTEGRCLGARLSCPQCSEPNMVTNSFCVRCGADLHPLPGPPATVTLPPPPLPRPALAEPPSPSRRRRWWPAAAAAAALVGLLAWALVAHL